MASPIINPAALEPLFLPHEEPNFHRVRAERPGNPAKVVKGRRPSSITVANNLRSFVKAWRESDYAGSSRRKIGGIFEVVRNRFSEMSRTDLFAVLEAIYNFRNEYVAHQDRELSDPELAKQALIQWASGLHKIWSCR